MIYKLVLSSDEVKGFKRTFIADPDATFLQFHEAIPKSVNFKNDQLTSFYICNELWEKGQEISLIELDKNFEYDNMTMDSTPLSSLLNEPGQRFIYVFDPLLERYFFGSLQDIETGSTVAVQCIKSQGNPPKQQNNENPLQNNNLNNNIDIDENLYGDNDFDQEDFDQEGFQNLSFDDGTMF